MVDYNDIINALNNLENNKPKATIKINKPGIVSSIPNYKTEKFINGLKGFGKGAGYAATAIPFYKDIAFPVANDMYNFIKGNPDKSKLLQFAIDVINGSDSDSSGSNKGEQPIIKNDNTNGGLVPLPELEEISKSDLTSKPNKQQSQVINNVNKNKTLIEGMPEGDTTRVSNEDDINIMMDYISRLQGVREPYIKALESYINNYGRNLDQARRADLYFYGANLAKGLDPRAGQKFNPLQNQADIINTLKLISDAKAGDLNAINELRGNMAVANQIDLPQEAAFANKNLLTALSQDRRFATDLEKARIVDAMRRYGYDTNYRRAIDQQNLRNQGNANTAMIYMGGGGGVPGVGLTQQGTAQPVVPLPQVDGRAQFFPPKK